MDNQRPAPSTLQIQLLGGFHITYQESPGPLLQARLQCLLAYLILHRSAPQSRQHLAFLFWPDSAEAQARANLRQLLHRLRQVLPFADDYLAMDASSVQWRAGGSFVLDVAAFEDQLAYAEEVARNGDTAAERSALQTAVKLYDGELLPGHYDDWVLAQRERLHKEYIRALERLIWLLEAQRDYVAAISIAQGLLRLDPLYEPACVYLMRLRALNGDHAGALREYYTFAETLQRELGVEPNTQTRTLYERLLSRQELYLQALTHSTYSAFRGTRYGKNLVGREAEWQRMLATWRIAADGRAGLLVVAGEAGIGKSRLAEELCTWVGRQGICTAQARAYAAEGALAYAPVGEWLGESKLRSKWTGLDEIWLTQLARIFPDLLAERPHLPHPAPLTEGWQRTRLFEALARAVLVARDPLLLFLDDLQWCDRETLEWIHYLLRYDPRAPLLIAGTLRREEVSSEHALTMLLLDLRRSGQLTEIDLGPLNKDETAELAAQVAGQSLPTGAGQRIYRETEGNPLYVVETVRAGLSESQGEPAGWVELPAASISTAVPAALPPKVHAVIQYRLIQLSQTAQELVSLIAVIGRSFTFRLLAEASDLPEDRVARDLDELWQRRIVREQGVDGFDFSHDRIRDVAYAAVSPVRRPMLHLRVARALETVHAASLGEVSGRLAVHYEQAGQTEDAIRCHELAAGVARRVGAYDEVTVQLKRGLELLEALPETADHLQQALAFSIALGGTVASIKGFATLEVGQIYAKALELCLRVGDNVQAFGARHALRSHYSYRGEWATARRLAAENLSLAQELGDPKLLQYGRQGMGLVHYFAGEFDLALAHVEQVIRRPLAPERHFDALFVDDAFQASLRNAATDLLFLGHLDQAREHIREAIRLGQHESQPVRRVLTLRRAMMLHHFLRDTTFVREWTEEIIALGEKYGLSHYGAYGVMYQGWLSAMQGEWTAGIAQIRQNIAALMETGRRMGIPYCFALLGEACSMAGQHGEALAALDESLAISEQTGECFWQAETLRLKGEALLALNAPDHRVESWYLRAIDLARRQNAKSMELRAALSLARLWRSQGKQIEAHRMVAAIYGWFSEGFDTPDLQEAQSLLEALS